MNRHYFEKVFSNERMLKYFNAHPTEEKAIEHYQVNIMVSESFYPVLSIFEVAFRNSINRELTQKYGTDDWYNSLPHETGLKNLNREIQTAIRHINNRKETLTGSKVVAELTLGFWVRLLNAEYQHVLWKDLRRAFPFLPKSQKKRKNVSTPLNSIRNFRNRVYHNEPISWKLDELERIHNEIIEVLGWINKDLPEFVKKVDKCRQCINDAKVRLSKTP